MTRRDQFWLGALLLGAALVWLRDLAWAPAASETLPILAALPLFAWLGGPWRFRPGRFELHGATLAAAAVALVIGLVLDFTFFFAVAWTLALWSWLRVRLAGESVGLRRLLLLPLMAFPWMTLDLAPLGWWFRITASWAADQLFGSLGFVVSRQGTNLLVHGLPIEVAPACSGMNSLQAILIAGIILSWMELRGSRWYWLSVATLPMLAWVANAARICSIVAIALGWGTGFARGWFHEVGGWLVVVTVFVSWWFILDAGCHRMTTRKTLA